MATTPHSPQIPGLVPTDAEDLRREELGSYHAACRALDRETRKLKGYEDSELPSFLTWVQCEFAEELATINDWSVMADDLERLLRDAERYADWKGVSKRVALAVIEAARLDGTEGDIWAQLAVEYAAEDEDDDEGPRHERAERGRDRDSDGYERAGASAARPPANEDEPVDNYMKSLYRKLVRALHPDVLDAKSSENTRLWHEVQDAYAWRDVHRLERLYESVVKTGNDIVNLRSAPISDLRALRKAVEASLRRIRTRLREAKRHLAWGFRKARASGGKLTKLRREIGRDIAHDLAMVRIRREELEDLLARWRKTSTPKSRAHARRPGVNAAR